ncbi:MAG: hypothetical protein K2V38_07190 [Gemmataceae bacterium]|nr:hypothetical protein [Gemmataceae bacterium]
MSHKSHGGEGHALPDGVYWFRNYVNLRGGGHVRRWKIAQVVGGRVRLAGSASELDQGCPYLRRALWVRAEPPAADRGTTVEAAAERVRLVAEGIVDVFVTLSDATAAYYARHPHHRHELVDRIAGLIGRAGA